MQIRPLRLFMAAMWIFHASAQTGIDLRTQSRNVDFSQASSTRTSKIGTLLPAVCNIGETFFLTSAPGGKNLYGCTATNVWNLLSGDGSTLQGRAVSTAAPTAGECLAWSTSNSQWEPSPCGSAAGAFAMTFPSLTTWTLPGTTHTLGTCDVQVIAMTTSVSDWEELEWDKRKCETAPGANQYNIVVTWATAQAGRLLVVKSGGGGGGGSPGGSDKNIEYNNAGAFGGVANNATATRMFLYQESSGTPALAAVRAADVPAVFPGYLEALFSHDFASIPNTVPNCAAQTFTMPGAVPGTSGTAAPNTSLPLGINVQLVKVTGLNTISIELCNQSATASYDPASLTFSVVLTGSQYR